MYSIFLLLILIITLSILFIKQIKVKHNVFFATALTILIVYFILNPKLCIDASTNGAKLFVKSILPTMFPFMVICNMLIYLDGIEIYSKVLGPILCKPLKLSYPCSFALVASFLCGYPLGAKYSVDLYRKSYISHQEFVRLLNIASNTGPLFLIGAVGTSMLGNTNLGYLLLIPSYLSALIIGIITKKKGDIIPPSFEEPQTTNEVKNLGDAIKSSIQDAVNNILVLCGYVIIFSVIISIFKESSLIKILTSSLFKYFNIPLEFSEGILLGVVELTNGCNIISSSNLSMLTKLCLLAFLSSFGGLSVIAQTSSFFYRDNVSNLKYFIYKLLQGFIGLILMFFIYNIFQNNLKVSLLTTSSPILYVAPIIIFLFITLLVVIAYKLFYIS